MSAKNPSNALSGALHLTGGLSVSPLQPAGFEPATGGLEILSTLTCDAGENQDSKQRTLFSELDTPSETVPNIDIIGTQCAAPCANDTIELAEVA